MKEDEFLTKIYNNIDTYCKIKNIIKNHKLESDYISIYILLLEGISYNTINMCKSASITFESLSKYSKEKLKKQLNISEYNANKILEAYNKIQRDLNDYNYINSKENLSKQQEVKEDITKKYKYKDLKVVVYNVINKSKFPVNEQDVFNLLKQINLYKNLDIKDIKKVIKNLKKYKKIIMYNDNYISFESMDINRYLNFIENIEDRDMLEKRLSGETLESIGSKYNISRERVRQKINKLIEGVNLLDDKYKEYFQLYNFGLDTFTKTFEVNQKTFYYLKQKYTIGKKSLEDFLENKNIESRYRVNLQNEMFKDYIFDGDEYIEKSIKSILEYIIRKFCRKQKSIDEIEFIYKKFLKDNNLAGDKKFTLNSRALEARIKNLNFIVSSKNKVYRYYNYEEYDFELFNEVIYLDNFKNKVISSRRLFLDYSELMEEYDIKDEYELHSLLKVNFNNNSNIQFKRMPTIEIGTCDLKKQIYMMIIELSPISRDNLVSEIENRYGFKQETIKANMLKDFNCYLDNDVYRVDYESLNAIEIKKIKMILDKEIYTYNQFKEIFFSTLKSNNSNLFNIYNIRNLGFRLTDNFIFRDNYNNLVTLYKNILLKSDFLYLDKIDKYIKNSQVFYKVFDECKKNLELIQISQNEYVNINKLQSSGLSKNELVNYRKSVEIVASQYSIFTIEYINKKGFYHKLYDFGFENIFFESLMKGSDCIKYKSVGGTTIFKMGNENIKFMDLCKEIINYSGGMYIHQIKEILLKDYGIDLDINKIKYNIKSSTLYYNDIIEKVYKNYQEFLEDIKRGK